jgi:hypothetical protein
MLEMHKLILSAVRLRMHSAVFRIHATSLLCIGRGKKSYSLVNSVQHSKVGCRPRLQTRNSTSDYLRPCCCQTFPEFVRLYYQLHRQSTWTGTNLGPFHPCGSTKIKSHRRCRTARTMPQIEGASAITARNGGQKYGNLGTRQCFEKIAFSRCGSENMAARN